jgi:hypothetical protein
MFCFDQFISTKTIQQTSLRKKDQFLFENVCGRIKLCGGFLKIVVFGGICKKKYFHRDSSVYFFPQISDLKSGYHAVYIINNNLCTKVFSSCHSNFF